MTYTHHKDPRIIAFYLPQFHPIPENDEWWGRGFTEWTNVAKARRLFRGHYQPRVPSDLGFYDLRLETVREQQAELAKKHGVTGFAYWHYWFAGRRILERPFNEVLTSGRPNFPFCLAWANESWSGIWHGSSDRILIEQTYPGVNDYRDHFKSVLRAFRDKRYMRLHDRPIFLVYKPQQLPDAREFVDTWKEESSRAGMPPPYMIGVLNGGGNWDHREHSFDAAVVSNQARAATFGLRAAIRKLSHGTRGTAEGISAARYLFKGLSYDVGRLLRTATGGVRHRYSYDSASDLFLELPERGSVSYPCIVPDWDNSPRSGKRAVILVGSTPRKFEEAVRRALRMVSDRNEDERIVFVKSWNEWAEGNYIEPDMRHGLGYLEAIRNAVSDHEKDMVDAESPNDD